MTPKQQAFARAYIETGNASEAYRRAYSADKMSQQAIAVEACKMLKNPKVALMVEESQEQAAERMMVTLQGLTDELEEARKLAMKDEKGASAAVAAVMGKAKLHGFLVDKSENVNHNYEISDEPLTEQEWSDEYASTH